MLMGGGGTKEGEQDAMNNMLPMILMMMDDNEVDEEGNPVRAFVACFQLIILVLSFVDWKGRHVHVTAHDDDGQRRHELAIVKLVTAVFTAHNGYG